MTTKAERILAARKEQYELACDRYENFSLEKYQAMADRHVLRLYEDRLRACGLTP